MLGFVHRAVTERNALYAFAPPSRCRHISMLKQVLYLVRPCIRRRSSGRVIHRAGLGAAGHLLALAAAGVLLSAPAVAAPALPRVTTITGDHSGYAEVELTQPLEAFGEEAPTVTFEGGGRLIGVVIRALPDRWGNGSPLLEIYRLAGVGEFSNARSGSDMILPAGRYRLYLIAEQPGAAKIEFGALPEGELALRPEVETPQRSGAISVRTAGDVVKFSERVSLWGGGVIFMTVRPTPGLGTQLELCNYWPQEEDEAGERAYDPGCPGGSSGYKMAVASEGAGAFSFSAPNHEWLEGIGGNVTTLRGSPGPVETYLFTASYEIARPASAADPPSTPPTWEGGPPPSYPGPDTPTTEEAPPSSPPPAPSESAPTTGPCSAEACSPPSHQYTLTPTPKERGTASLASRRVTARGRRGRIRLRCSSVGPCRGRVGFLRGRETRFRISAGQSATLRIRIPRAMGRRLRQRANIRAWVRVRSELFSETRQSRQRVHVRRS